MSRDTFHFTYNHLVQSFKAPTPIYLHMYRGTEVHRIRGCIDISIRKNENYGERSEIEVLEGSVSKALVFNIFTGSRPEAYTCTGKDWPGLRFACWHVCELLADHVRCPQFTASRLSC